MKDTDTAGKKKTFFYNRLARAIIPVGRQTETGEEIYEDEDWIPLKIKLTGDDLIYEGYGSSGSIKIKKIYYMDRKLVHPKGDSPKVLSFNYQTEDGDFIALIKNRSTRSKEILKKRLLRQIVKDANVWYIMSYGLEEGSNDKRWCEGIFKIGEDNTLRIENPGGEIVTTIPPEDVVRLNPITKLKKVNLEIYRWKGRDIQVDLVYSTEIPLDIVTDFFYVDYLDERRSDIDKKDITFEEKKALIALEKKENDRDEDITIPIDELISYLQWGKEKTVEVLSSMESKGLITYIEDKILRTFPGVDSTPERLDVKKHKKKKELELKKEEREKRLQRLLRLKKEG